MGKEQGKTSMDEVDISFPKDYSEPLYGAPCEGTYLSNDTDLPKLHLPEVIFLEAGWLTLAELLSINSLKLTFPFQGPPPIS